MYAYNMLIKTSFLTEQVLPALGSPEPPPSLPERQLVIGASRRGYPEVRNFLSLPFKRTRFKRVRDINWLINAAGYWGLGKSHPRFLYVFNDLDASRVDGFHFFNAITPSRKPWVVTFESSLPRVGSSRFEKGYRWMAAESCKALIAISQRAHHLQSLELDRWPQYRDAISTKLQVIHPPQQLVSTTPRERGGDAITITFVGGFFFHKGGLSLLKAFARMKQQGSQLRLNIVSSMHLCGWRDRFVTDAIQREARDLIANTPGVKYWKRLSANDVISLFEQSDVGILPSFGETYGYSVLEAMACGCAVIVPRTSPFTEIVDDECAYFLDLPSSSDRGLETIDFSEGHDAVDRAMTTEIMRRLGELESHPEAISRKAKSAIRRIARDHCPQRAAEKIEMIYAAAIER